MADVADPDPIPDPLRPAVRALLRGENAVWPGGATAILEQHGIAPLLYARLAATGQPDDALRAIAIRAAAAEERRLDDLRTLLDAFAKRGIRALILKGTALAYSVYDAPELRPRGDTDLLIDERDAASVRDTMESLGYEAQLTSGDTLALRQQSFSRGGHVYDVHWDVVNPAMLRDALPFAELAMRAVAVPRIAPDAFGLSHPDALLLACLHRVAHHHGNERLIWLYDIHLLREAMDSDDHARFWRVAAERRVVAICEASIELADSWFASAPHDRARDWLSAEELARREPSAAMLDSSRRRGAILGEELRALRWRDRARRLRELALPPRAFMRRSFPAAPRAALPALYVWRAARGVLRMLKRVR